MLEVGKSGVGNLWGVEVQAVQLVESAQVGQARVRDPWAPQRKISKGVEVVETTQSLISQPTASEGKSLQVLQGVRSATLASVTSSFRRDHENVSPRSVARAAFNGSASHSLEISGIRRDR